MKRTYIGFIILCIAVSLFATQMIIHKIDGTDIQVDLSDIESITFEQIQDSFTWCLIPAGDFTYGESNDIQNIDYDYEIMKYEVTNAQYLAYLQEAYANGDIWVSTIFVMGDYPGDEQWEAGEYVLYSLGTTLLNNTSRISYNNGVFTLNYPSSFTYEDYLNHPVVFVTWFGGWHFSHYYGWRLPTEQEWEKAARGMTEFAYPWGNNLDGSRANYWNSGDPYDQGTTPVGFYNGETHIVNGVSFSTTDSPSPYGVYDMAGNVWNRTDSFWNSTGTLSNRRVLRGGSWSSSTDTIKSWNRDDGLPTGSYANVGFRSARTLD